MYVIKEKILAKIYSLYAPKLCDNEMKDYKANNVDIPRISSADNESVELVSDKLLCQLHSLHIAENAADASSEDEDDDDIEKTKQKEDDREFLTSIKSFVSAVKSPETKEVKKTAKPKVPLTDDIMEEKLKSFRSKYGKAQSQQKKIIIIDPLPLKPGEPNL